MRSYMISLLPTFLTLSPDVLVLSPYDLSSNISLLAVSKHASMFLSQGLGTFLSLCLDDPALRYPLGFLPHLDRYSNITLQRDFPQPPFLNKFPFPTPTTFYSHYQLYLFLSM